MINKDAVGNAIAMKRKEKGLTQKEFAGRLNVSCQAVSKWEIGKSLPTVELMNDIASVLGVTVDFLLNSEKVSSRDICYLDTGLDTISLYALKERLDDLTPNDGNITFRHFVFPVFYKAEVKNMGNPRFVFSTYVPGSKQRLAREYGKDKEIAKDLVARAINFLIVSGVTPQVFQGHIVCGNKSNEQIAWMAEAMADVCRQQGVDFGGLEISAQPINYLPGEYELSGAITGIVDKNDIITGEKISESDVMIVIETEGIETTSVPFIRVMLERNRALALDKVDNEHIFIDEVLKPNRAFRWEIEKLKNQGILHGALKVANSFTTNACSYDIIPDGLVPCINMSKIKVRPLYAFLRNQDMIGDHYFPSRFSFGVSIIVVVPECKKEEALSIINESASGYEIGKIEKGEEHVRLEGKVLWK